MQYMLHSVKCEAVVQETGSRPETHWGNVQAMSMPLAPQRTAQRRCQHVLFSSIAA